VERLVTWRWLVVLLVSFLLVVAKSDAESKYLHLKLVWRQQLEPRSLPAQSIFSKPPTINDDFVVRNVTRNGEMLVFDADGVLTGTFPISPEATLSFSPTNTASVLTELKADALSPGTDDAPSALTGFLTSQKAWQRLSFATSTNLVADSGFSVELNEFIARLRVF